MSSGDNKLYCIYFPRGKALKKSRILLLKNSPKKKKLKKILYCVFFRVLSPSILPFYFRYKDFADAVVLCAKLGNYTKDDELIVVKKAQTIVDCFIDSQIAPRIQVSFFTQLWLLRLKFKWV